MLNKKLVLIFLKFMNVQIRKMKTGDFNEINTFLPKMWFFHASSSALINKNALNRIDLQKYLFNIYQNKNQEGFVAVLEGRIIGFIRCEIKNCPDFYSFQKELYVDDLIVLKKFRKKGVATKLILKCFEFGQNNNINLFTCKIWKFNKESKSLFKNLGFQEDFSFYSYQIKK